MLDEAIFCHKTPMGSSAREDTGLLSFACAICPLWIKAASEIRHINISANRTHVTLPRFLFDERANRIMNYPLDDLGPQKIDVLSPYSKYSTSAAVVFFKTSEEGTRGQTADGRERDSSVSFRARL